LTLYGKFPTPIALTLGVFAFCQSIAKHRFTESHLKSCQRWQLVTASPVLVHNMHGGNQHRHDTSEELRGIGHRLVNWSLKVETVGDWFEIEGLTCHVRAAQAVDGKTD
jgi:hypothetical protein